MSLYRHKKSHHQLFGEPKKSKSKSTAQVIKIKRQVKRAESNGDKKAANRLREKLQKLEANDG